MNTTYTTYSKKLLDPRWQKLRLQVFERDNFTCRYCESTDKTLHAHHRYYEPNTDPWDYPLSALVTLCCECHDDEHNMMPWASRGVIESLKKAGFNAGQFVFLTIMIQKIPEAKLTEFTIGLSQLVNSLRDEKGE